MASFVGKDSSPGGLVECLKDIPTDIPTNIPAKTLTKIQTTSSSLPTLEDQTKVIPDDTHYCSNGVTISIATSPFASQSQMSNTQFNFPEEELNRLPRLCRCLSIHSHQDNDQDSPCAPTFLGIAVEIRNMIYELLLLNPEICKPAFSQDPNWSDPMKLGISPAILRTSRQIYDEASLILYEKNTFLYTSVESELADWRPLGGRLSPIFRNVHSLSPNQIWNNITIFSKIRKWKVILASRDQMGDCPATVFVEFCRAFSIISPPSVSLEIVVIPRGADPRTDGFHHMSDILHPLLYLRGLKKISFRDPTAHELPRPIPASGAIFPLRWNMNQHSDLINKLTLTAMGNEAVEMTFKLYNSLRDYIQAFERYLPFKEDMDLLEGKKISTKGLDLEVFYENPIPNPFKANIVHPVESALMYAKDCSYRDASAIFKIFREHALDYLESQWEELDLAATAMSLFIKQEKRKLGLLNVHDRFGDKMLRGTLKKKRDEALYLVESYAAALERGMPRDIKRQFNAQQRRIDAIYNSMDRYFNLCRLRSIHEIRDFTNWREWFQIAVDELDTQYFEIRNARQKLFDWDISNEPGCDIRVVKTFDHDERINWEVNEPDIGCSDCVRSIPAYHPEGDSDFDSDSSRIYSDDEDAPSGWYDYDDDATTGAVQYDAGESVSEGSGADDNEEAAGEPLEHHPEAGVAECYGLGALV